jgi:integrase
MAKSGEGRRDYGDGSLYQRKSGDGRWVGSFRLPDGTRKYVYGESRSEAKKLLEEAKKQAEAGTLVPANAQTVAEFMEYWLSVHKLAVKASTHEHYGAHIQARIVPALGKIKLQKLSTHQIQKFINGMDDEGLEPGTIKLIFSILKMALADAVEWKFLGFTPCKGVVLPRIEATELQVLNFKQVQLLLESVKDTELEALVTVALCTGLRRGELLALKWADIDRETWHLKVQRTLVYLNGQGFRETEPKTKGSKRTIPVIPLAQQALEKHRKKQVKARLEARVWENRDLVFCDSRGGYIVFTTLYRAFYQALERAGLPPMRIHDLRHSAATLLLALKVSIKVIQAILGHSSLLMTLGLYGHLLPGATEMELRIYNEALQQLNDLDEEAK